jgi:hypothetical protein
MKTTLTPVTAIFVAFGYVVLAIGFVRYLLLRHRKERALLLALTLFGFVDGQNHRCRRRLSAAL